MLNIFAVLKILTMINKELQEQRMRGYFVQATKELLKGEGINSVNVRNIAQHAGYSYATMYHYFRDVKELIFLCVGDFQKEIEKYVAEQTIDTKRGKERLKSIVKNYMGYFVQYPSIFNLFFIERLGDVGLKHPVAEQVYTFLDKICGDEWDYLQKKKGLDSSRVQLLRKELNFATCGMLVYYMNRMQPADYQDYTVNVDAQLDFILDKTKAAK